MMEQNYYQILGVSTTAYLDEIKKAYRQLVMLYHPDKESGDHARFIEIQNAYEILKESRSRQEYDRLYSFYNKKEHVYQVKKAQSQNKEAIKKQGKWDSYFKQFRTIGLPEIEAANIEIALRKLQCKYYALPMNIEVTAHHCKYLLDEIKKKRIEGYTYTRYIDFVVNVLVDSLIKTHNGGMYDYSQYTAGDYTNEAVAVRKECKIINKISLRTITFISKEFDISINVHNQLKTYYVQLEQIRHQLNGRRR
ncbi:MAG: DnaJ domain-containing protein [Prevotellaceae bacterium]|jgi:hypothetical protein|nr:DnaJ domain-containing protein [Prevotellaceae bacterium]